MTAKGIEVSMQGLKIDFGEFTALHPTDLTVRRGELFTLLGPSGCGKTTLLRCLAGFLKPSRGSVTFDGKDVTDVDPWDRGIGFVFQNYALWPTKTIFRNVAYGLEVRKTPKDVIECRVAETLDRVELTRVRDQYPGELSGGMQQRAALARAIIIDPPLLLFDEPLSNLDAKLRVKLRRDIRALQSRLGLTAIYVTHDQEEALDISDRIAVMQQGEVCQIGTPREVYEAPQSAFVADFVGKASFLRGKSVAPGTFQLTGGEEIKGTFFPETTENNAKCLFARPESIEITTPDDGQMSGTVVDASYLGPVTRYEVEVQDQRILVETRATLEVGSEVGLRLPNMQMFDTEPPTPKQDETT